MTGQDLTTAILAKKVLMDINNCTQAYMALGHAIYGQIQDDANERTITTNSIGIPDACAYTGGANDTAVWHFSVSDPVHHFMVMPFRDEGSLQFSVLMAYAGKYMMSSYIDGSASAPDPKKKGFKRRREIWDFQFMLSELVASAANRLSYFGAQGNRSAMTYYKYPNITIDQAAHNLANFNTVYG